MAGSLRTWFGSSRWKKESREKSKAQDGPEIHGSIASANSSEVSVLRPEQAASSTTVTPSLPQSTIHAPQTPAPAVPPTPSSKTLPVLSNTSDKAARAPQTATDGQAVEIGENLVAYVSLWDRAYDALKEEEPDRVTEYEQLLSRVLIRVPSISQLASNQTEDVKIANQVPQNDPIARREKLKEITELGLKHMEDKKASTTLLGHGIVLQDVVAKVAGAVEWVEGHVKDAIKDLPYASIVMAGVSLVLPLLKNPAAAEEANRDGFTYVTSQMRYFAAMESLLLPQDTKPDLKDDFTKRLINLYKLIIDFQIQSVIRFYRTQTKNFFRGAINYDGWDQKLQYIKDTDAALVSRFETTMSASRLQVLKDLAGRAEESRIALDNLLTKVQEHIEVSRQQLSVLQKISQHITDPQDHACLQGLRITDPHDDKSRIEQAKGGLLTGSYYWVLDNDDFRQWRNNQDNRLLWIKGDPGKGKTMLLCGIIDELTKSIPNTTIVSFFFCQATDARLNNATAVLRGLIFLLVNHQPSLISHVRQRYDQAGKQLFEDANAWEALSKIFAGILEDPDLQSTYLVIDALDECTGDLSRLLNFIAKTSSTYSNIKWIVSSRNWPNIEKDLLDATQKVRLCLELNEESVSAAVATYIQSKVDLLAKQNQYDNHTRDAVRAYLSSNAYGTFLWVALVCQELAGIAGWEAEEMLTAFPPGLDALYERMMSQICSSRHSKLCKNILAVVSVVRRPITLDELPSLVDMPPRCSGNRQVLAEIVGLCGSFLTLRDHTIAFVHQSAKDFLVQKASREIFPSGIKHIHRSIFSRSLRALANILRRDIYGLGAPGFPIDQVKQPNPDPLAAARYSCVYWIDHLSEFDPTRDEVESIDRFLRRSYLYWLEALSLLRIMSGGVIAIGRLEGLLGRENRGQLTSFVRDAHRFALAYRGIIEQAPLQAYASALVFAPTGSLVKKIFKEEKPGWLSTGPVVEMQWNACTQTLEGHGDWVLSVAFSPDGQRVASGSRDNTIKIWDTASGTCTQTLEGHGNSVLSVAFSPDSQRVASGSDDDTIKIWDTASGTCTQTLEGHGDSVLSVTFSPDGQRVASGSDDKTIKIWDTASGTCTQTLEGHGSSVLSVTFSPDGQRVASGSHDKTIKIWDTASGTCTQTLEGHGGSVWSVAFSPDGQRVASGSDDDTIKIWDTASGTCTQTLEGHGDWVRSVTFSPDGQRVASGSHDKTIKIWDTASGTCTQMLEGHGDWVLSVTFSPDGQRVASGSDDETIKIWDTASGTCTQTLEGHGDSVLSVTFSPDGQRVASGSHDKTIKIWDTASGTCTQTLEGHGGSVWSVAFSPDGQRVASGSDDDTIKIWDTASGTCTQTLEGHGGSVLSVAFSPDGQRVAPGSDDKTIKIWDTASGTCTQTLEGHGDWVRSVAFSPDGQRVASGSRDNIIKIWDTASGTCTQTLEGHGDSVWSVTFSPDGQRVASGSRDKTIKIWDTASGTCTQTLNVGLTATHLSFDHANAYINTNIGRFQIATATMESPNQLSSPACYSYGLGQDCRWIICNNQNVLWLPLEYYASASAMQGRKMVLGSYSGRVIIFLFSRGV